MNHDNCKIGYVVADLKRIGPTNQTLNIIRYSGAIQNCVVITLFKESDDTQIKEYLDLGIKVECLHLSRKSVFFNGASKLCQKLKDLKIDIVHSWGTFADITAHYACKKLDMMHIITLRCFPIEDMTTRMNYVVGRVLAEFDLHILKNSKHVVACSNSIKQKMESTYSWAKLDAIQNGVDFNKFQKRDKSDVRKGLGINKDTIVFISMGSMIPRKRIEETADAFIAAKKDYPAVLWFLGDGMLLADMKKKYSNYADIIFWGKQSDVVSYLSAADIFVSSSESEGMPNAVLEAIACGLPVFLSDIPQHLEVFDSISGCGKAYELGNINGLTELIELLTGDEILRMHEATQKLSTSDFTMEKMGKKYAVYYDSITEH